MSSRFKELTAKFPSAFALSMRSPSLGNGGLFQLLGARGKDGAPAEHFPFFADGTHLTPSGGAAGGRPVAQEVRSAADGAAWLLKEPRAPHAGQGKVGLAASQRNAGLHSKRTPPVVLELGGQQNAGLRRPAAPPPTTHAVPEERYDERYEGRYLGWFGDGTVPYPEALWAQYQIPLDRLLIVRTPTACETWRLGAEACGTGLFRALCLQPSAPTDGTTLRRLQLEAERHGVTVALLTNASLPHWPLSARWHCEP